MASFDNDFQEYLKRQSAADKQFQDQLLAMWRHLKVLEEKRIKAKEIGDSTLVEKIEAAMQTLQSSAERITKLQDQIVRSSFNDETIQKIDRRLAQESAIKAATEVGGAPLGQQVAEAEAIAEGLEESLRLAERRKILYEEAMQPIEDMRVKMKELWDTGKGMLTNWRSGVLLVGAAALKLVNVFIDGFIEAREAGFSAGEAAKNAMGGISDSIKTLFTTGQFISPADAATIRRVMSKELGGIASESLRQTAALFVNQAGFSAQEAAQLASNLYRLSGYSDQFVDSVRRAAKGVQQEFGIPMGEVLREIGSNAEIAALYIGRTAQELANAGTIAFKTGISLQKANQFSDSLVSSFEDTLTKQAELQTMFGAGFDLTQATYAAQYGTPDQVAQILSQQIRGLGFENINQIPRSMRNALAGALGMSMEELQAAFVGGTPGVSTGMAEVAEPETAVERFIESVINPIAGAATEFAGTLTKATLGIAAATAVLSTVGGLKGLVSLGTGATTATTATTAATAGAGAGAGLLGGSLLAKLGVAGGGLAAGIGIGELINQMTGMYGLADMVKDMNYIEQSEKEGVLIDAKNKQLRELNRMRLTPGDQNIPAAAVAVPTIDTTKLESKIDALIAVTKENRMVNIYLDGKKVSDSLLSANARGR